MLFETTYLDALASENQILSPKEQRNLSQTLSNSPNNRQSCYKKRIKISYCLRKKFFFLVSNETTVVLMI